jgi:hypothetical protein
MRTITITGLAVATLLMAGSGLTPAQSMPIQPAGVVNHAAVGADNYQEVYYRRRYVRPYGYGRRYGYGGGYGYGGYPYGYGGYGYGGYPYGYGYYGPSVQVGPFGFGFGGFRRW